MAEPVRHILVFIHSLHGGGAERVAVDLCAHWVRLGWCVTLVTQTDASGDAYALDPAVQRIVLGTAGQTGGGWRSLWANMRRIRRLRRVLKRVRPDMVLGMMTTSSVLAVLAAWGLPCHVIASEHTHPPVQSLSRVWRRLRRWTYPRAACVVALTRDTERWLRTHVPGVRTAIIPNPVSWPLQGTEPVVPVVQREARRMLLAVGRLHRVKGFDLLLEAWAQQVAAHPDWDLVILGEGGQRAALQAQIRDLGLDGRVRLPGRVGNVAHWYEKAELYVLSSRAEGLSNTLLEAMACGLAVVAFDCDTGPRDIVNDGVDGLLVRPAGDVSALAQVLGRAMDDAALRARLGAAAQQVRARYAMAVIAARWQALFDALEAARDPGKS